MANISISDLYQGEGPGKKYGGILSAVLHEIIRNGIPEGCDERTWTEQLIVKHTFLIAKKMAEQGDVVSELTETTPPFCMATQEVQPCSGAHSATCYCSGAQRESNRSGAHRAPPDSDHHTFAQDAPPVQPETGEEETE